MMRTVDTVNNKVVNTTNMKEIIRQILKTAVILVLIVVGFKFVMSFKKEPTINELVESVRLVKVQKVALKNNELFVPVYGHLKSLDEIELFPEVGGMLESKDFREGETYKKGDVIAYIENDELVNSIKSQKSNLLNQVAKLVTDLKFDFPDAVVDWEKFLDEIKFDVKLPELPAVNDLKLKKYLAGKSIYNTYFSIQSQEERLDKYKILAPFDGVLAEALIKPGTVVRVGQKIGKLINPDHFELEASVSLVSGNKIEVGDVAMLRSNDVEGDWKGKVVRINKTLSESSQNMDVFINVSSSTLYNGMYLLGEITLHAVENSIEINRNLLDKGNIYTVVDGQLTKVKVNVMQINEENAIVTGLNEGDVILAESIKGAYEGLKVRYNQD